MSSRADFFAARNPQAVLKHGVLARYAYYFAGRAGRATRGKVAFIDGYAGAGRYADDTPGSPLLLASEAQRAKPINRDVRLAFVETNDANRVRLAKSLTDAGVVADIIEARPFGDAAPDLLDRYAGHAVFAFLDPFGLAVSRQQLVDILQRSDRRRPVDVLYHFSVLTVARMGMAGISPTAPNAAENATQLDRAMGALVDWRGAFAASPGGDGAATETAIRVAHTFGQSILEQTGVRFTAIEVRQQPTHLPKYLLMLFSADPTGEAHWEFAGNAAKAYAEWLLHCDTAVYEANLAETERHGVMSLFEPDPAPTLEEVAKSLAEIAARYFDDHLARLIRQRKSVRLVDDIEGTFGAMLGRAGEPAVRASIKRLRTAELIDDDGTGDFHLRTIKWVGPDG